jgi:SAM-dependent methyltransferase
MEKLFFCAHCKDALQKTKEGSQQLVCPTCSHVYDYKNSIAVFEVNISKNTEVYWESVAPCTSLEQYLLEFIPQDREYRYSLDLGSGEGRATEVIAPIVEKVVGLDTSYNSLTRLVQRNISNVVAIKADAKNLPFPADFFDLVISLSVVEHIPYSDLATVFSEVHRTLAPNGLFVVRNDGWFYGVLEKMRIRPGQFGRTPDSTHVNMMTGRRFAAALTRAGFVILREDHFPFFRYEKKLGVRAPRFIARLFATHSNFVCTPIK